MIALDHEESELAPPGRGPALRPSLGMYSCIAVLTPSPLVLGASALTCGQEPLTSLASESQADREPPPHVGGQASATGAVTQIWKQSSLVSITSEAASECGFWVCGGRTAWASANLPFVRSIGAYQHLRFRLLSGRPRDGLASLSFDTSMVAHATAHLIQVCPGRVLEVSIPRPTKGNPARTRSSIANSGAPRWGGSSLSSGPDSAPPTASSTLCSSSVTCSAALSYAASGPSPWRMRMRLSTFTPHSGQRPSKTALVCALADP